MGGLAPLVALLRAQQPPQPHLQAGAAYVLGTAAANNVVFQKQLLGAHPEVLQLLLQLLADGGGGGDEAAASEAAAKALYCLSALLRLSPPARAAFYRAAGMATLQSLLRSPGTGPRLKRKGLGLLADLVQLDAGVHGAAAGLDMSAAVAAALQLLDGGEAAEAEADQDLQVGSGRALEAGRLA